MISSLSELLTTIFSLSNSLQQEISHCQIDRAAAIDVVRLTASNRAGHEDRIHGFGAWWRHGDHLVASAFLRISTTPRRVHYKHASKPLASPLATLLAGG